MSLMCNVDKLIIKRESILNVCREIPDYVVAPFNVHNCVFEFALELVFCPLNLCELAKYFVLRVHRLNRQVVRVVRR